MEKSPFNAFTDEQELDLIMVQEFKGIQAVQQEPHYIKLYKKHFTNPVQPQRVKDDEDLKKLIKKQAKQKVVFGKITDHIDNAWIDEDEKVYESNKQNRDTLIITSETNEQHKDTMNNQRMEGSKIKIKNTKLMSNLDYSVAFSQRCMPMPRLQIAQSQKNIHSGLNNKQARELNSRNVEQNYSGNKLLTDRLKQN